MYSSKEDAQNKKALKIRKILLTFVDKEIKKKKKKNNILINSMNSFDLEKLIQIKEEPINSTIYFTNITEKHIVKRIVDKKNNINYFHFYSDNLDLKDSMLMINKMPRNFLLQYKKLRMNIGMPLKNEESKNEEEEGPKDFVQLYSFNLIKKEISENKIISNKFLNYSSNKIKDINETVVLYKGEKKNLEDKKKISLKFLLKYCYSHIKRKIHLKSVQRESNINLLKNNYEEEKNNEITKKKRNTKSKDKNIKMKKQIINNIKEESSNEIFPNKSIKNNCFVSKLKKYLENNKMKHTKRVESTHKINSRNIKMNTHYNYNVLGTNYDDFKDSNNNKNYEKMNKKYSIMKKNTRNNISDFKSTLEISPPENTNFFRSINKYKRSFNYIFHYKKGYSGNK